MHGYRFETHFHTQEVSGCATVAAAEAVRWYHQLGYTGLVVTDHYYRGFFEKQETQSWANMIDTFLSGYEKARRTGSALGIVVLPGMEIRFDENNNDYLVFGIDRDFLLEQPRLYEMSLRTFGPLAHRNGLRIYQAHPLRNTMTVMHPHLLDGMEVYNGNPRHDARNDIAALWADRHNLAAIAGSDFHKPGDEGSAGIDLLAPVCDNDELLKVLTDRQYTLYTG
ncbi:MAG: PHP-associated domain-containing protein [Bacillota bacterium]|nr:PHP-associated domain-containing protein [Bacillota bacterium]